MSSVHVDAERGRDDAEGTRDRPSKTLTRALEYIRSLPHATVRQLVILSDLPESDPLDIGAFSECGVSTARGANPRARPIVFTKTVGGGPWELTQPTAPLKKS
jgi:hypothetical protein